MKNIELNNKMSRPLDRVKLNLRPKYSSSESSESESDTLNNENRVSELINMWWNKESIIGKILKYIYEKESVTEDELKEFLEINNYSKAWYSDLAQSNKDYKIVFERKNNITKINKEAREYVYKM